MTGGPRRVLIEPDQIMHEIVRLWAPGDTIADIYKRLSHEFVLDLDQLSSLVAQAISAKNPGIYRPLEASIRANIGEGPAARPTSA